MIRVGAKEVREMQAEMLDTVQRELATIEKNGRAVAVLYSYEEARAIEQTKLELLKAKCARSDKAISQNRYESFNQGVVDQIKSEGRKALSCYL